jgi:hypothetical protein
MNLDIKNRFLREIHLRGFEDKYVDRNEEREVLQIAIQLGVAIESARLTLAEVCQAEGYVLESAVIKKIQTEMEAAVAHDGRVDRQEFEQMFTHAKTAMRGLKTDREIKTLLIQMMEDTGNNRVKTGWFTNWYRALKKELGMG